MYIARKQINILRIWQIVSLIKIEKNEDIYAIKTRLHYDELKIHKKNKKIKKIIHHVWAGAKKAVCIFTYSTFMWARTAQSTLVYIRKLRYIAGWRVLTQVLYVCRYTPFLCDSDIKRAASWQKLFTHSTKISQRKEHFIEHVLCTARLPERTNEKLCLFYAFLNINVCKLKFNGTKNAYAN